MRRSSQAIQGCPQAIRPSGSAGREGCRSFPRPRRLPPLLRRAWFSLNQAFRRRIAHLDITPDQYSLLRILAEAGPGGLTQRQLTELVCSDANTIASLIERMVAAGLVERRPHEADGRAHCVLLRGEGSQKLEQARAVAVPLQAEIMSVLPPAERPVFLRQLERVAAACQKALHASPRPAAAASSSSRPRLPEKAAGQGAPEV